MSQFDVIAGPDSTPVYPLVRKIGPADLKDALAKGIDDFLAMPSSHVFLGLIYPIAGLCLAGYALPLLFPLMAGFALVGPFAGIGLYEMSRRRELGLDTSWEHAFDVVRSHSILSILSLGLLLLVIFAGWELTAQALYVALLECNQSPSHRLSRISSIRRKAGSLSDTAPRSVSSLPRWR